MTLGKARRALIASTLGEYDADDLIALIAYAWESDANEARFWRGEEGGGTFLGLDNLFRKTKLPDRIDRARKWSATRTGEGGSEPEETMGVVGFLRSRVRETGGAP